MNRFTTTRSEHQMPVINVAAPASSAPTDRLALVVASVRPGVAGNTDTLSPSGMYIGGQVCNCFEGTSD